ncbi:response regulator [Pyxidicoccus sp. 3LFB2]
MTERKRVLLVEDSENDAELALAAFEEAELTNDVVVVRDGQEALDYLQCKGAYTDRPSGDPAVVLLDLKLPRVNGLEVLEKVKADPALKSIPVVMLTSSNQDSDLARSYGLGVNAYVVKPVDFPEFMSALKELGLFWTVINQPPPRTFHKEGRP